MSSLSTRLKHRVDVYEMAEIVNELEENDTGKRFVKQAYCEIIPMGASVKSGPANTESNEHQYKVKFRKKSIPNLKKDWFFLCKNWKYEVLYFNEDFKNDAFIEVFCKRIEE